MRFTFYCGKLLPLRIERAFGWLHIRTVMILNYTHSLMTTRSRKWVFLAVSISAMYLFVR
jgi:hypothetical protein